MDNYDDWAIRLKAQEQEALESVVELQRSVVFAALGAAVPLAGKTARIPGLILRTPVDTGRARSSINISKGEPDTRIPPEGTQAAPSALLAKAGGLLRGLRAYSTVWLSTSLVYFQTIEFGGYPDPVARGTWDSALRRYVKRSKGGFSKQAPQGVFRKTFEELRQLLAGAL